MSGEQFTQVRRPVSRLTEKILGWLSWIFLLLLTVATMFIALVSFSSDTSIQKLESSLNANEFAQQIFANNNLNTTQAVIWLQNGVWAIIVYLIVCLLISFLALISMNIRILSGFLFLIATIVTLPLMVLFVPLIIPVLFIIVAIMMFARKDRVETIPAYYDNGYYDRDAQSRHGYDREPVQSNNKPRKNNQEPAASRYQPNDEPTTMRRNADESGTEEQQSKQATQAEEENKDYNSLRRGGYSSEVARQVNGDSNAEEEPQVLSRQAKYNYKNKKNPETENTQDEFNEQEDYQRGPSQEELDRQEAERQQQAEEDARRKQEEAEEKARLKQERAEEKSRIKQEKKELRKRMKEKRKQQPSAVNQRRMNYEERKKMTAHDDNGNEQEVQDETSDSQDSSTDNKEK